MVQIESRGTVIEASGVNLLDGKKLRTRVDTMDLVPDATALLRYVVNYVETGVRIRDQETLGYGYWLTHFTEHADYLEIGEYSVDGTTVVPGVTRAVRYWRAQNQLCAKYSVPFMPPTGSSLVVISNGIMGDARAIQGVRYPCPSHMSGWWLTDDEFDGNVDTLKRTHAYHLASLCPQLVHLLALPFGYRFDLRHHEDVWFDEDVAHDLA